MIARRLKSALRDQAAALLHASGVTRPKNRARLTIVTFHRVLPSDELTEYPFPRLAVTPDELAWLLEVVAENFECGALGPLHERWAARSEFERPPLAVTFDDGQVDNFRWARPVLNAAGIQATFFAVSSAAADGNLLWHDRAAYAIANAFRDQPNALRAHARRLAALEEPWSVDSVVYTLVESLKRVSADERERWIASLAMAVAKVTVPSWDGMMTFEQLRELVRDGHELGSHSHSHPILPLLPDDQLRNELEQSRAVLSGAIGQPVTSLCYPNGDSDERVAKAARAAGYRRAVTTAWGWNPRGADPLQLKRCDIQSATIRDRRGSLSPARLAWRISGLQPGLR